MNHSITLIAILFVISMTAVSQSGWQWLNPKPQGNILHCSHYYAPNKIVALGTMGTMLKTTDSGTDWNVTHTVDGYKGTFTSVHLFNDVKGIATTSDGLIFTTLDGGASWSQYAGLPSVPYLAMCFPTPTTGYIFGGAGAFLRSNDSGKTWSGTNLLLSGDFCGCSFINAKIGTAISKSSQIIKTTDGGDSWLIQKSIKSATLFCVDFLNENFGIVGGVGGLIMKTTDGGMHWDSLSTPTKLVLYGVKVFSENEILAVGGNYPYPSTSIILKTTDGGKSWNLRNLEIPTLFSISFIDDRHGCAVGAYGGIAYTSDQGETWDVQGSGFYDRLRLIKFTSAITGYMVSEEGVLFKTTDGGINWKQSLITASTQSGKLEINIVRDHYFFNDETAYLFIRAAGLIDLIKSTDGGVSWTVLKDRFANFEAIGFCALNENWITIVGSSGRIIHSSDGGVKWIEQNSTVINALYGVKFFNENIGYAVGESGTIIKTTNGGAEWKRIPWGGTELLTQVYLPSSKNVLILGSQTLISTNAGDSWKKLEYIGSGDYVHFSDESNGLLVSAGGAIWRTWDGGQSWSSQPVGTYHTLLGVFMKDSLNAYVVGDHGAFFQTKTGGLLSVRDEKLTQPRTISLSQNYPNPFSESTTINFQITDYRLQIPNDQGLERTNVRNPQSVILKFYDIFGREVLDLSDEARSNSSVTIHRSQLPGAGVYFYRRTTPFGIRTQRMLMLR